MNFQNLTFDHVEAPRTPTLMPNIRDNSQGGLTDSGVIASWPTHAAPPSTPKNDSPSSIRHQRRYSGRVNRGSSSTQQSVIRSLSPQANSAPQRASIPSQTESASEVYGPDRLFANPPIQPQGFQAAARQQSPAVRFDEAQLAMFAADNAARMASIKDDLALAAGKVTPGVDDTPYIQYALQALVGGQHSSLPSNFMSGASDANSERFQELRGMDDEDMTSRPVSYPQPTNPNTARVYDPLPLPGRGVAKPNPYVPPPRAPSPARAPQPSSASVEPTVPSTSRWVPITKAMRQTIDPIDRTHQPLTFKPQILRPFSLMILMILCMLMAAALIFSARYSYDHSGLTPYPGSIYSGQYFLFRILPQLLGAVIFMFAQSIMTTSLRILPFTSLASEDPSKRYMALFQRLYPTSLMVPQLVGPWQFKVFDVATWLSIFTIPLLSSAFSCIFVHEKWIWAPVQGIVWTLVALYLILLLSTGVLLSFWFGQWTGLIWDVRSIGDLLPLLNRSNGMESYRRSDLAENKHDFKNQLSERWLDRLGYWKTEDTLTGGIWYSIGGSPDHDTRSMAKRLSHDLSFDSRDVVPVPSFDRTRGKYLPLALRDGPAIVSVGVASLLLLGLLVVSFLPQTRLEAGFFPKLSARPDAGAFSAANFVFNFVPSLIGMMMFLSFQSIDQALRVLQPWSDLYGVNGSLARRSLLADYAACLPLQATWKALKNGHWRVAVVSLLAAMFVFIPVLAGGLLMALTSVDGQVRMYPSMPVFGVLLAFLFLYVGGLSLMVPHRKQFLLPRPVTSIAEIISLCAAEELTNDAAFRAVRGREDLEGRLGVGRDDAREESVWFFGIVPGRDEQRLSVRRMKRFTEKRTRSIRSMI